MTHHRYRIGFDIGGTFTDFVLSTRESGDIRLYKCLTTPEDPSIGALDGLGELITATPGSRSADVGEIVHGTTLVTNAVIERKGARLGLITTAGLPRPPGDGHGAALRHLRPVPRLPGPLVAAAAPPRGAGAHRPRRRASSTPLDEAEVAARRAHAAPTRASRRSPSASCTPTATRSTSAARGEIVREDVPGRRRLALVGGRRRSCWEYQRCVTTCANAYVQPLDGPLPDAPRARARARGLPRHAPPDAFGRRPRLARRPRAPSRSASSNPGPAGGALATALFGARAGKADVISFDMGGTTAKACLIEDGRAEIAADARGGRACTASRRARACRSRRRSIDMIEIGAGGGSIAAIDEVGLLRVGPHSAGADPGPGLLRPRRRRADRHRRQPRARLLRSRASSSAAG